MKRPALLLVGATSLWASAAGAEPQAEATSAAKPASAARPAPAQPAATPPAHRPAIETIARSLARTLPELPPSALVVAAPLESDASAPRGQALAELVASRVAGERRLGVVTGTHGLVQALARARGASHVLLVAPSIAGGRLRASASLHPVPSTVWARIRQPLPGAVAHAFAEAPIDAEVRAHLEPIPITAFDTHRGRAFESGVLALACDDFDRDGAPEILSVSRHRVTISRIQGGRVVPVRARAWSELSPVHASPHREPIGSAVALALPAADPLAERELVVSLTDRALALRLDARLEPRESFPAFALAASGSYACARLPAISITGPLEPCAVGDPPPGRASVGGRYDALASAALVEPTGKAFEVWAGREDGALEIFDDTGKRARLPGVGAQLALGDLDQDGRPELLRSLDVDRPGDDAVVVATWDRDGRPPRETARFPVAAGVHALAVCPPDGPGRAAFVVATPAELLVVR